MYGSITVPGGIGLPDTDEVVDQKIQEKLAHALESLTVDMNISGKAETAGTANKLKTARKIGNANFDGSANITLEQMGAAASNHTHAAQTSVSGNAGTATKLQTARKIGNANFDGSANITLEQMGAAASGHTHTAQTDISGNAGTANKLKTARKIGNANFDGSANITLEQMGAAASGHTHTAQTDITGNAGTANKWKTARKINGLSIDGSADRTNYAVCTTAAGTAAKAVNCSGFVLETGAEITVKFTVTNTAANPTLNVNGTGAKPIYYRGSAITAGYLAVNRTYAFRYNGTQYELVGDIDTNTTYNHPTSAGNKHIPAGGSSGKILKWSADDTAVWGDEAKAVTGTFSVSGPSGWTANQPAAGLYQYTLASGTISGLTAKHRIDLQASYETLLGLEAPVQALNDNGTCKLVSSEPLDHSVTLQYTLIPIV